MKNFMVFDIGGTEIKYGVISEDTTFLYKNKMASRGAISGKLILDDIIEVAKPLIEKYSPVGIAVSSAGVINSDTGEVLSATNTIVDYIGMNVVNYLNEALNLPVSVMNDVKCMALCEANIGAGKGSSFMIALTIGTGIGGSIVLNSNLINGSGYAAGEFGLMSMGNKTFEEIAATSILVQNAKEVFGDKIQNGVDVFKLYDEKDIAAIKLVDDFYENLSVGISNLIYALNPETVVIGGGVTGRPTFINELQDKVFEKLTPHLQKNTKLYQAYHKNDAGMLGAYQNFLTKYPSILLK